MRWVRAVITLWAVEASGDAPEPVAETTVTSLRLARPLVAAPANTVVLPREEIDRSPAFTTDNLLRAVPSVATFRRSSSLVSDPTTQGLNLRGTGPSGVSRALVLVDGIPANDPFGGWVYWRSMPRLGISRIEIVPSGSSALYGSSALGGVVQILSAAPERNGTQAEAAYGTFHTGQLAARTGHRFADAVAASVEGELFSSGGYPVVAGGQRGDIDRNAWSRHGVLNGHLALSPTPKLGMGIRMGLFKMDQSGGTRFTSSSVEQGQISVRANWWSESFGSLEGTLFGKLLHFSQERARVSSDRNSEALAASQRVPANEAGASLVWSSIFPKPAAPTFMVGVDYRQIYGLSREQSLVKRDAGGRQQFAGLFLQALHEVLPLLELQAAVRFDVWRNSDGRRTTQTEGGERLTHVFEDKHREQLSPRVGLLYRASPGLSLRGSAYRAFRAPTLNELYRPFQVGTLLTAANEALGPEKLWGAELGFEVTAQSFWTGRATGFYNRLDSPISNVTLAEPLADGATRQRRNLGSADVRGVELALDFRFSPHWTLVFSYLWSDSKVTSAPGMEGLAGKALVQVPRHRATGILSFQLPRRLTAVFVARAVSAQFDDDLNALPLGGFVVADASVIVPLGKGLEAFVAAENLFDRSYLVGRAGVNTVGQPFTARLGIRLR